MKEINVLFATNIQTYSMAVCEQMSYIQLKNYTVVNNIESTTSIYVG